MPGVFWDNYATMHVVTHPGRLTSIETFHHPITLNNIGAVSVSLIHKNQLRFLRPGVAEAYNSPQVQSNLFNLS